MVFFQQPARIVLSTAICVFGLFATKTHAQVIPTGTGAVHGSSSIFHNAGLIGIATPTPAAGLHINNNSLLLSNPTNPGRTYSIITGSSQQIRTTNDLTTTIGGSKVFVVGAGSTNNNFSIATTFGGTATNRFFINGNTGFVGIGTPTPSSKLHVGGAEGRLLVNGSTASDLSDFVNTAPANTVGAGSSVIWAAYNQAQSSNPMLIQATGNTGCTGCYQDRFVVRNAGNVGIENSDPKERLQIGDRFTFHNGGNKYIGYNATWNGSADVRLVADEASRIMLGGDGTIQLETSATGAAGTAIAWTPSIKVNNDGKVTIGSNVNTPGTYKLYVEQGILTEKVKVAVKNSANWADYVFADNYPLSKLTDVETFVKQNKHLPNMPSAEEMVKNGLDVATMDAKLLEKIEELTLYMIQMQKENVRLQKEMDGLKTTITSLQKQ